MILIAESGSTKCDWVLINTHGQEIERWNTMGFNPYFHSAEKVQNVLSETDGLNVYASKITQTWFYGAGCSTPAMRKIIADGLNLVFANAINHVNHDLNAAAFALYNGKPAVACILGTGSNSCFFDGKSIREEVPALAYILGDEGSASFIGKQLVADFLYKKLPADLHEDFVRTYNTNKDEVLNRVYHQPYANVYLASFGPFAGKHTTHPYIQNIVRQGVKKFVDIHVLCYPEAPQCEINFVGSVAKAFEDIVRTEVAAAGLHFGRVLAKPVNQLVQYHITQLGVLKTENPVA